MPDPAAKFGDRPLVEFRKRAAAFRAGQLCAARFHRRVSFLVLRLDRLAGQGIEQGSHPVKRRRMIDRHGELLDALQVLANKSLTGRKVEKDIELDCENFKGQRIEDLEQRAREIADRVRKDGREFLLPAMSPIERRIVHMALREDADVTTESRGEGFFKRVAIIRRAATES